MRLIQINNVSKAMVVKVTQSSLTLHDPMDCSLPGSSVHGFSRQEYWSRLPFSSPVDLPKLGNEPMPLTSPALTGRFFTIGATWEAIKSTGYF